MEYTGFEIGGFDEDAEGPKMRFESTGFSGFPISENDTPFEYENTVKKPINLSQIIGTMKLEMATPNSELTDEHISAAKMVKSVHEYYSNGLADAQRYLDVNGLNKSIINRSRYGLFLRDRDTGKYTLALRGMNPLDPRDIFNASQQTAGTNESIQFANEMLDSVSPEEIDRVVAFSMGGGDGFDIAVNRNLKATLLDPAINPRHILKNSTAFKPSENTIEIVRNPESFISVGTAFRNLSANPQYKVTVVPTGTSGILANHDLLPNFSERQMTQAEQVAERLLKASNSFAQHDTLIDMTESINRGETFTQFYRRLNSRNGVPSGVDVDVGGVYDSLGSRVNSSSQLVRLWSSIEGTFTEGESQHLRNTPSSSENTPLTVDRDILMNLKEGRVELAKTTAKERYSQAMRAMNENEVFSHPAISQSFAQHMTDSVQPIMLTTGILGAFVSEAIISRFDPTGTFGQMNETGRLENQAVSGAMTGVLSDIMNQGLSGSNSLLSKAVGAVAISSAVGTVAGEASRYGIRKALNKTKANSDTKESISDLTGGAVGGATAAVSADAIAVGTAVATGGELGALGGPVGVVAGAGVGAVFGTLAYAVGKVGQSQQAKVVTTALVEGRDVEGRSIKTRIKNEVREHNKKWERKVKNVGRFFKRMF